MELLTSARRIKHQLMLIRRRLSEEGRNRARVGRRIGASIPETTRLHPTVRVGGGVVLGERTWINHDCVLDDFVTIGNDVALAPRVFLCTVTNEIGPHEKRTGEGIRHDIMVGDGVWIGAGAIVLPGVSIGDGCVIGVGSVVTKDCAPDGLYVGNPAVRVRTLP